MLKEKTTHSFIIENEKQDDFKCKWWDVESSLAQRDALSAEKDVKLDSSCNHTFL